MSKLNTFEIFLNNQYSEVSNGSTLHGQIVLDCPEDMKVTEITVQCHGRCRVELYDFRFSAVSLMDVHGAALASMFINEIVMDDTTTCFPTEDPQIDCPTETENNSVTPTTILTKGMNVFDFQLDIPYNVPASFEGEHGYIRYFLRAQVNFPNEVIYNTRNFKVIPVLDLNCLPDAESVVEENAEVEIFSFFKSIGFYEATMSLHKSGYVPGDTLHVQLDIHNNTLKDISRAVLRLKMVTTYRLNYQTRQTEKILCTSKLTPIEAGYTFHGCDRNLLIPKDVFVSNMYIYSRYIYVSYYVELILQPSLLSLDSLKMYAKIEVGTVPLSNERLLASLVLRAPPPRYEDLLPRYEDALHYLTHGDIDTTEACDLSCCDEDRDDIADMDANHSNRNHVMVSADRGAE